MTQSVYERGDCNFFLKRAYTKLASIIEPTAK